jgi:carboxymethylenebutenolidase
MHDLQRYLVEEFAEEYQEGRMSRRDMLRRVLLMTGSVAITASALSGLGVHSKNAEAAAPPRSVRPERPVSNVPLGPLRPDENGTAPPPAQTSDNVVDPHDPAIVAGRVSFGGAAGDVLGYLAQPADDGIHPGIVVVHENRGLVEPNMDITRRYAKEGYAALAVDLISRLGGTDRFAEDPAQIPGFLGRANPDDLVSDLLAGLDFLSGLPAVDPLRLGLTSFCFGGGLGWRTATVAPFLKAVVPYYGSNPPLDRVPNIGAAVLGIYAELDTRTTSASDALYAALDTTGVTHDRWIAPGAAHAFFNNTGSAYNPAAAMEAWNRTLAWFAEYL